MKIEKSCGCVFCDLGLKSEKRRGRPAHYVSSVDKWIPCALRSSKSSEAALDRAMKKYSGAMKRLADK